MRQRSTLVGALATILFATVTTHAAVVLPPSLPVYGPASPVTSLNAPPLARDWPSSISGDGLKIVLFSNRAGADDLYSATRATPSSAFSAPSTAEFVNINSTAQDLRFGVISPDGLELFYTAQNAGPPTTQLMHATRAAENLPFSNPQVLSGLQIGGALHYPSFISPDGLRLYYWNSNGQQHVAARATTGSTSFGAPSSAPFVNLPYAETSYLTPDELQMFLTSGLEMYWTWRPDLATPFAVPQPIASLNTPNAFGPVPFGNQIFFSRNQDIYQATLIPEPATLAGVSLLVTAIVFDRRRRPQRAKPPLWAGLRNPRNPAPACSYRIRG
jgi:hypothetical protein